jgi:hypothetical protein
MTLRRATLYIGGGTLLVAWFSSAASLSLGRSPRRPQRTGEDNTVLAAQGLAVSVQSQARRLKERLAAAPLPQQPLRNPFAFSHEPVVRTAPAAMRAPAAVSAPAEIVASEPPLLLIGLAERRSGDTIVRSAVVSSDGQELIMAEVGTVLLGRYKVTAIGSDAVELEETATGRTRRLVLQNQPQ